MGDSFPFPLPSRPMDKAQLTPQKRAQVIKDLGLEDAVILQIAAHPNGDVRVDTAEGSWLWSPPRPRRDWQPRKPRKTDTLPKPR